MTATHAGTTRQPSVNPSYTTPLDSTLGQHAPTVVEVGELAGVENAE